MEVKVIAVTVLLVQCISSSDVDKRFIGVGYDYIMANPDGQLRDTHTAGIDPGIHSLWKILELPEKSLTQTPRSDIAEGDTVYENTKNYQNKLKTEVNIQEEESFEAEIISEGFSGSFGAKLAHSHTQDNKLVIKEHKKTYFKGSVRYNDELVEQNKFHITDSFAAAVCRLPAAYEETKYLQFVKQWGTHVIMQVMLGIKEIERFVSTHEKIIKFAEGSVEEALKFNEGAEGESGSLAVDMNTLKEDNDFKETLNESLTKYTMGSEENPEPIGLTIKSIAKFVSERYWSNILDLKQAGMCKQDFSLTMTQNNLKRALKKYPTTVVKITITDELVSAKLEWPLGTYGLVQPSMAQRCADNRQNDPCDSVCPTGKWFCGRRYHDTEDHNPHNIYPSDSCIVGDRSSRGVWWGFCMKHIEPKEERREWPPGEYCIFKRGDCPTGFNEGSLLWDDEDSNRNSAEGSKPDGKYDRDTLIYFCCREDRSAKNPIYLPPEKPFYLLAANDGGVCQRVHGTTVTNEAIRWDDEDSNNGDRRTGHYPYDNGGPQDHYLTFCFYRPK